MNSITNLSAKQLRRAAKLKEKIAALENELTKVLGGSTATTSSRTWKMSPAAKAKISAKLKAAWARRKAKGAK